MTHTRRSPRALGFALDGLQAACAPETTLADVQMVWREVVGEVVAREAAPVSERAGVLTIFCTGSVWAHELDLMAPVILDKLNQALRGRSVKRLRCITVE